jgi:beta-glucanase (GH16 family)
MKKMILIVLLTLFLVGCTTAVSTTSTTSEIPVSTTSPTTETTTTSTTPTTTTTTSTERTVPNGLAPLSPVEDCLVPELPGGWICIWADEFSGTAVDETKWNFEVNGDGGGNNELQYYRRENATVADGFLSITAKSENYMGKLYTSARLNTKYKGSFENVRIIVRAKMPSGRGTWPAIWMMPLMNAYGGWPDSGEIDIIEYVGYDPDTIHCTIHTEIFNHKLGTQLGFSKDIQNAETEFHDYELVWSPGHLEGHVDGTKYAEFNYMAGLTKDYYYHQAFPFDSPFFLILNVAVGGNWGGAQGVDPTIFPTSMEVDYVRVYKLDYAMIDEEAPTTPTDLEPTNLDNTLFWRPSTDDYGVEGYAVFVNGQFKKYTTLNQVTLTGLTRGVTYDIQVQAVDFVGRASELSSILSFTYE